MASRHFFPSVPVLAGLLALTACEHPRALPSAPSPRAEAAASVVSKSDVAALQRTAAALAADPGIATAAGQAVADLSEAKKLARRLDSEYWARLEAAARSQSVPPVPPR